MLDTLNNIKIDDEVRIINIDNSCNIKRRLMDFGMVPGTYIKLLYESVFGDPKAYLVRDTVIAIRDMDSKYIEVNYED